MLHGWLALTSDSSELLRLPVLAHIYLCAPISGVVIVTLAAVGSATRALGGVLEGVVCASLFMVAGVVQWFVVIPWLIQEHELE